MTAETHTLALLFALPAGILFYFVLAIPGHPWTDMRSLCAATLLFCIPLFGYPEAAGAFVLYFGIGLILTGCIRRWLHQQQPSPDPPQPPEPKRHSSGTTGKRAPIIFKRQRRNR